MNLCNNRCTKLSAIWFISYFLSTYCAVVVNISNHSSKYQMGNRVNHRQLTITGTYQSDRLLQRIKDVCQRISTKLPVVFSNETDTNQWNYNQPSNSAVLNPSVEIPNTSHFWLSPKLKTMACLNYKVASSSLKTTFAIGSLSSSSAHQKSSIAESVEDFQHANASYFKFTIVRHPMDRLLSCYIDKLLSNKEDVNNSMSFSYHVKKRGKQLAMQTSRQQQVVKDIKTIETKAAAATDRVQLNEILPTFEDFLEFVLATPFSQSQVGMALHWAPYHHYCTPCSVPYDFIGKLETAKKDFQYILRRSGLRRTQSVVFWLNRKATETDRRNKEKLDKKNSYYASLPRDLIIRLYHHYQLDFQMFDYDIDDILLTAGHELLRQDEK